MKFESPHTDAKLGTTADITPKIAEVEPHTAGLIKKIEGLIKADNVELVKDLKGYPEFLDIPEIRIFGESIFNTEIANSFSKAKVIFDTFNLPQDFLETKVLDYIINSDNLHYNSLVKTFKVAPEFLHSEKIKKIVLDKVIKKLQESSNNAYNVEEQLKLFSIDSSDLQTKENKAQVIEILKKWIEDNGGDVFTADHDLYGAAQII